MLEEEVRKTIIFELKRQAEASPSRLKVTAEGERARVEGEIDLAALAMAVVGSVAGGP